ncbi:assimilatory sulfite reductase (NADPH) flavoprotein subunit [Candidatus Purcelliella pentastirinorum]|uniref:assimilatory sulfite reductase (NADPH) flavoprotein subunit n=1 Tax=Candidatus Purcelliella pentastirinorum TaxID=472834 RepID=UPI00237AA9C6|nr:assimilatory sulfite reductase (NADPH) flavoprotein subunit [Candidatus Purcelliella pentastirinorum]WDR80698.1 assimilatory sulfite reductase (NADPH) flavoprotein subunit [Candidatus Purcelliella pentastirinorum]
MKNNNNLFNNSLIDEYILKKVNKIINKLSIDQIIWLSGYLFNIIKNNKFKKSLILIDKKITILSSSQTGNAQSIAKKLYDRMVFNNFNVILLKTSEYKFKKINNEKILIIITSTYGEGEPPEETYAFYNFLMSKRAPKLDSLSFAVFGLGDSSYKFFNKSAKDFDHRLKELGAKRLINRCDADIDYSVVANNWIKKILNVFKHLTFNKNNLIIKNKSMKIDNCEKTYDKENPLITSILCNQKITGRDSNKDIRHIEINLPDNIFYEPGDILGVWYENDPLLIKKIISCFKLSNDDPIKIGNKNISLYEALLKYCEITINTINIVKKYSYLTNNKYLLSINDDLLELQKFVKNTPLIDMFIIYKSKLSAQQLVSLFRPLSPRFYSISSSQREYKNEVHITVRILKYKSNNCVHFGGASGYLGYRINENDKIKIFLQKNNNFKLPKDSNIPIIMIAAGTGISPFRSFIQERENIGAKGKNWLFFGDQKFTEDFLYQIEWVDYLKKDVLNNINLAWSRDQKYKIYIQDKIIENKNIFWKWINNGAYIYICGSIAMSKSVETSILKIIQENGKIDKNNSVNFLNELKIDHRYQKDVY